MSKRYWVFISAVTAAIAAIAIGASRSNAVPIASFMGIGDLPGGWFESHALAISADGSVVVGASHSSAKSTIDTGAFIWDAVNGMRSLQTIFTDEFGLDLTGWKLGAATGISDDGLTIVGTGINPEGNVEGWIADLHGAS